MKSERCKNWMPVDFCRRLGSMMGAGLTVHDEQEHGPGAECKEARVELAAMVIHLLKLDSQDVSVALERVEAHLKICDCPGRGKSQKE